VIREWSFTDGALNEDKVYEGHSSTVRYIGFNSDQSRFITCCEDQSLRVWDFGNTEAKYLLSGHKDFCVGGEFLDDKHIVSVGWDMCVKFYELPE